MYERIQNNEALPSLPESILSFGEPRNNAVYALDEFSFISDCDGQDRFGCYQLRNEVYVDECQWSESYKDVGIEVDLFDAFSSVVAVKNREGDVVATLRSTNSIFDWMAIECYDGIFKSNSEDLKIEGINEISRLCIKKSYRNFMIIPNVSVLDFLLAGMIFKNKSQNIRGSVIVTHISMYVALKKKGLNITMLTESKKMSDGCKIGIFYVDVNASLTNFKPIKQINKLLAVK